MCRRGERASLAGIEKFADTDQQHDYPTRQKVEQTFSADVLDSTFVDMFTKPSSAALVMRGEEKCTCQHLHGSDA
jgi:hypothetical protein